MRNTLTLVTILIVLALAALQNSAVAQSSPTPNEIFKAGYAAYQSGNYDLAIKHYTTAINADPTRNYFYYNRGLAYKAIGNYNLAAADFRTSNQYKPTAEAYYQLGLLAYEKNDLETALAEFEKARELKEDLERMNFYMGMIYYKNNRYEEAVRSFQTYTRYVKNFPDAYYYRGMSEAKLGRYSDAIASFNFAMTFKKYDWKLYYKMYEIYLAMNDKHNALYSLTMVIEVGEKKPEYYEERARLFKDIGDLVRYEEDLQTANEMRYATASIQK
ncbi:MAG: tetratricopeptide repeat protein [Chitinophagales bacterium]|nr:tetratricopeptide repeat protein [Chitinophagales bacterium]MDW8420047.1 tetratricopeptide repeat protein [Chitinophagales bacterium]